MEEHAFAMYHCSAADAAATHVTLSGTVQRTI